MDYNVITTEDAERDFEQFITYLLYVKKNEQAARNLMDDFEETLEVLSRVAGSIKFCTNPKLKTLGYKRINFQNHRYFMLFRVEGNSAIIEAMFHELQDYENQIM